MDQCCKTILNGAIPDLFVFTYFFFSIQLTLNKKSPGLVVKGEES